MINVHQKISQLKINSHHILRKMKGRITNTNVKNSFVLDHKAPQRFHFCTQRQNTPLNKNSSNHPDNLTPTCATKTIGIIHLTKTRNPNPPTWGPWLLKLFLKFKKIPNKWKQVKRYQKHFFVIHGNMKKLSAKEISL